ncbi:hypothetical protein XA68_16709 [Ophiocordyceps unilateralis]|uniref:RanBD1 domain-containing protein n=1 Tax=Ophiocordyceps unilateralis TaxID=268505 RepID=A0A2A9P4C0_OPHUN|nr:hypothetical protein XA68_16709 [Ophiocordyceps unilateralis]
MVTFSLPADDYVADATNGTPKSRSQLPFAKRSLASSSSFGGGSARRNGTPYAAPARRIFGNQRDEMSSVGLSSSSIATARNIFRASTFSDSPPSTSFSPSLPQNTMKRVFAPGATPESSRTFRHATAQATPRGMAAKAVDKELFPLRIASPPAELTGEALTQKIPKEWNSKGSIYADQFLSHLCPAELDEEQRRQFFCILDLRRLKYAANEIFCRKDWKLNAINFAKEFEKSRSIILLRYGLYEFQNVKPSDDVLKKWRREHGLAEPDDEAIDATPSRVVSSKKRKASDDFIKDSTVPVASAPMGKRRAIEEVAEPEPAAATPGPSNNKRKASVSGEPPAKLPKSASLSARALFEKVANKETTAPGNLFSAPKPSSSNLARSVLTGATAQGGSDSQAGSNIFSYLSDASSAKNSGVEADAESESESGSEEAARPGHNDKSDLDAGGEGEAGSQTGLGNNPFTSLNNNAAPGSSSIPGTRESTPGRSLFQRITKGSDGHPVRAEDEADKSQTTADKPAAPLDQTWNPNTTPIKFAPTTTTTTQSSSLFGSTASAPASNIFAPKTTTASANFGQYVPPAKEPLAGASADQAGGGNDGGESDKENESKRSKKSISDAKLAAAQPPNLFGAKSAAQDKPVDAEPPKTTSLFGSQAAPPPFGSTSGTTSSLFAASKPDTTPSNPFATVPSAVPTSLFGAPSTQGAKADAAPAATDNSASQPTKFSFGAASSTGDAKSGPEAISKAGEAKSGPATASTTTTSGGPKSPSGTAVGNSLFDGSPMKQDDPSPAKNPFGGGTGAAVPSSLFSFGVKPQAATDSAPGAAGAFGKPSGPAANDSAAAGTVSFGAGTSSTPSTGGFNFNFGGGATSGSSFTNPFAKISDGAPKATSGGLFNFDTSSGSTSFQFGSGANGSTSVPAPSSSMFGQSSNKAAPAFAGVSGPGGAPSFNLPGGQSQASSQGSGAVFGSSQPAAPVFGSVQPPAGGSSTTGTNSPLNFGGGGSSLATTPAAGTPEHWSQAEGTGSGGDGKEGEEQAQISLTDVVDADEEVLHDVRVKALKFTPPGDNKSDSDDRQKTKPKSPWTTRGVGPLRILKHRKTGAVRLVQRAEPRGNVVVNRTVLPTMTYKADGKYVKVTTSTVGGDGLETWMMQTKTKELATELAAALEESKGANKE